MERACSLCHVCRLCRKGSTRPWTVTTNWLRPSWSSLARGDLTWRKLIPAVFDLFINGKQPQPLAVLGLDRVDMTDEAFREHLRGGVEEFSARGKIAEDWQKFAEHLFFQKADFADDASFATLKTRLQALTQGWPQEPNIYFYFAVPPSVIGLIASQLGKSGLAAQRDKTAIVVEKPFGHDLESARPSTLN